MADLDGHGCHLCNEARVLLLDMLGTRRCASVDIDAEDWVALLAGLLHR